MAREPEAKARQSGARRKRLLKASFPRAACVALRVTHSDPVNPNREEVAEPLDARSVEAYAVESIETLESLYPSALPGSRAKQHDALTSAMTKWLKQAPFFVLSSLATTGIDCSPRGDAPGTAFTLLDRRRIAIPDRRGNNRIDSLRNIVRDPRVGLVFMIPGIEESLRVRGTAMVSVAPDLLEAFPLDGEQPASVIVVTIDAVWVQNFRSIRRAGLWREDARVERHEVPDAPTLAAGETR